MALKIYWRVKMEFSLFFCHVNHSMFSGRKAFCRYGGYSSCSSSNLRYLNWRDGCQYAELPVGGLLAENMFSLFVERNIIIHSHNKMTLGLGKME